MAAKSVVFLPAVRECGQNHGFGSHTLRGCEEAKISALNYIRRVDRQMRSKQNAYQIIVYNCLGVDA